MGTNNQQITSFGRKAVYLNIFGIVFSGLVFPVISTLFYPQPIWQSPELFINSFHPVQTATFFCGFFLVIGSLMTFITLYLMAGEAKKVYAMTGLAVNIIFTAIVFLNYVIQTTYVPYLASNNPPETASVLPVFSMANPGSFAWALEMYGWGGIGLSFIFMAFIFGKSRRDNIIKTLFIVNGTCSMFTALLTSYDMNWIFSPAGFASLIVWNSLVFVIDLLLLRYFKETEVKIPAEVPA